MNTRNTQEITKGRKESKPRLYQVHNDIIFIIEYVSIDQKEPLEIIQCYVDVGENKREVVMANR